MEAVTLHCGDAGVVLAGLPARSVHATICSPPYFGLRAYNGGSQEIGLEQTPQEYVAALVEVFRGVRRVLRDDGTLWVVLGDSYASGAVGRYDRVQGRTIDGKPVTAKQRGQGRRYGRASTGIPQKSLLGIPWRVAFALQDDGWLLRQEVIWHKPNPMPESVKDRCTRGHETVFMLAKGPRYYYDQDAVREPLKPGADHDRRRTNDGGGSPTSLRFGRGSKGASGLLGEMRSNPAGRNKRSVWTCATSPLSSKKYGCDTEHYAAFPPALVRPMVRAATSERGVCPACGAPWRRVVERRDVAKDRPSGQPWAAGIATQDNWASGTPVHAGLGSAHYRGAHTAGWEAGCSCRAGGPVPATVLDCFCGSGTAGLVARQEGRRFVGIDLNEAYLRLAAARIATVQPALFSAAAV